MMYHRDMTLLAALLREIVSAQHTVYHTAPIYEDDIDEMSSGGVVGCGPRDEDSSDRLRSEIVKRCKSGDSKGDRTWCLYSHKEKLLGRHKTPKDAYEQERAIKSHKP